MEMQAFNPESICIKLLAIVFIRIIKYLKKLS